MRHLGLLFWFWVGLADASPFAPWPSETPAIMPGGDALPSEPELLSPHLEEIWVVLQHAQAAHIRAFLSQDSAWITPRGLALVDERTNRLLLRETPERLAAMQAIVKELDTPLRQIQLEARIVVARSNQALEWGMGWGLGASNDSALLQTIADRRLGQQADSPFPMHSNGLSVISAQGHLQAGLRGDVPRLDRAFDLQLSALEQQGYAEIVSQPRLLTADGHEAVIASGTTLSFPGAEGGTTFVDALLSMRATPKITADGRIMLHLEVAQDSPAGGTSGTINTNSLKTQVLVADGETIVLGGVYRFEDVEELSKVPLLGDLPLLGGLFRQSRQATLKNELLIFLTPTILPY